MAENESPNGFQRDRFPEGEVERVLSQLEETRREILFRLNATQLSGPTS
jgi:hypothetical protein